jgi:hypothetical protein
MEFRHKKKEKLILKLQQGILDKKGAMELYWILKR